MSAGTTSPLCDVGGREVEIAAAEALLGRTLPPSVREWVAMGYDVHSAAGGSAAPQDSIDHRDVPGHPALALWLSSSTGSRWAYYSAILHSDLVLPDPPVYQLIERITNDRDQLIVRADEKPEAESVSSFAMRNLPLTIGEGGGFQAAVEQPDELRYQLTETFATAARIGRDEVYEADNLIAWLRPPILTARGNHLVVDATRALGRDRIPPFLLDRARLGFDVRGIFLPEAQQTRELVPASGPHSPYPT